jgi:hypothetical protein
MESRRLNVILGKSSSGVNGDDERKKKNDPGKHPN